MEQYFLGYSLAYVTNTVVFTCRQSCVNSFVIVSIYIMFFLEKQPPKMSLSQHIVQYEIKELQKNWSLFAILQMNHWACTSSVLIYRFGTSTKLHHYNSFWNKTENKLNECECECKCKYRSKMLPFETNSKHSIQINEQFRLFDILVELFRQTSECLRFGHCWFCATKRKSYEEHEQIFIKTLLLTLSKTDIWKFRFEKDSDTHPIPQALRYCVFFSWFQLGIVFLSTFISTSLFFASFCHTWPDDEPSKCILFFLSSNFR